MGERVDAPVPPPEGAPHPYIPNTPADVRVMLDRIGVPSTAALFADLPAALRDPPIDLPAPLAEAEVWALLHRRAAENRPSAARPHFLGAGAYRRHVPAVVGAIRDRSEFMTAYTPYQPEISQGTLQAAFEYQTVVCDLTGLEVSNTGLYDVASATAEACLLAARVTGRRRVRVLEPLHPGIAAVIETYATGPAIAVLRHADGDPLPAVAEAGEAGEGDACWVVQQPDYLGRIVDLAPLAAAAHAAGALLVAACDPLALGMLRAPGDAGVDIVTGEGRDLAGPSTFGGPSLGLFAARRAVLRQMPGRIVGRAREIHGDRTGYVLTLQAREQFIRRERATSNFSTGQTLVALGFTVALQALGPGGLRRQAELCYQRAHDAARRIDALPGFAVVERGPWFQEFLVRGPCPPRELAQTLAAQGIRWGLDVSDRAEAACHDAALVCVTEATPPEHIDALVAALAACDRAGARP